MMRARAKSIFLGIGISRNLSLCVVSLLCVCLTVGGFKAPLKFVMCSYVLFEPAILRFAPYHQKIPPPPHPAPQAPGTDVASRQSRGPPARVPAACDFFNFFSKRHVDASLDLFTRKSPRTWRDLSEKRALSARRLILMWMVGV